MKFIVGDFFKLSKKVAGSFEAVFDRGSLVLCVCVCVCECVRESERERERERRRERERERETFIDN